MFRFCIVRKRRARGLAAKLGEQGCFFFFSLSLFFAGMFHPVLLWVISIFPVGQSLLGKVTWKLLTLLFNGSKATVTCY